MSQSIYDEIGVQPVINARGTITAMGGNTPSPVMEQAMKESENYYAHMSELLEKSGEKIATLLGSEGALVTSGCTAALILGAAACMTGTDDKKIRELPFPKTIPSEFIAQEHGRNTYERSLTFAGATLRFVGDEKETTKQHIEEAITEKTAGIFFFAPGGTPTTVNLEDVLKIAHKHNLPVLIDAAGEVYPPEKMIKYVKMGADLVGYGGKYFGGFNSSGLLLGKKELIKAARLHTFMGYETITGHLPIGRGLKLDRQEIIGTYVAVKEWLNMNHEDRLYGYDARAQKLITELSTLKSISVKPFTGGPAMAETGPATGIRIFIDPGKTGKSAQTVIEMLANDNPRIWVSPGEHQVSPEEIKSITINLHLVTLAQEKIIIEKIKSIFRE